jgi:hypothetical protein
LAVVSCCEICVESCSCLQISENLYESDSFHLAYERINQHSVFIFGNVSVRYSPSKQNAQMDFSLSVPECPLYHHCSLMLQLVHFPQRRPQTSARTLFITALLVFSFEGVGSSQLSRVRCMHKSYMTVCLTMLTSLAHWLRRALFYAGFLFLVAAFLLFHIFAQIVRVPRTR